MARCQVKTGFLVLRDCENPADETCSVCGSFVCLNHKRSHPKTQQVCCIDCYAKALDASNSEKSLLDDGTHCCNCGQFLSEADEKVVDSETNKVFCQQCFERRNQNSNTNRLVGASLLGLDIYEDDYWYGYRNSYYRRHNYRPFLRGSKTRDFDEDEVRAFNPKNNPEENGQLDDASNKANAFDS